MEDTYCLSCRGHTPDLEPYVDMTKNGRFIQKSACAHCLKGKSKFLGGSAAVIGAVARAAPEVTKNVGKVLEGATELVSEQLERGHEKRKINKKYEKQAAKHAKRVHTIQQREFAKLKKQMKKGKFPQMSDEELFDYITESGSGLNNQGELFDDGFYAGYYF